MDPAVLTALRTFDTPTICNVLELFDHRPRTDGYLDGRIRACFPHLPPMVGFAVTATFRAGAKAPECAGVIHTDLQRGFIRAEVIRWDELLEIGSWSKAKQHGMHRVAKMGRIDGG